MKQTHFNIFLLFLFIASSHTLAQITYESNDTLTVRGRCVIFCEPSASDLDSLMLKNESVLSSLTEFRNNNTQIISFLNKKMIPVFTTEKSVVLLQLKGRPDFSINKSSAGGYMGIILSDGIKDPLLLPGVTADTVFYLRYRKYFEAR